MNSSDSSQGLAADSLLVLVAGARCYNRDVGQEPVEGWIEVAGQARYEPDSEEVGFTRITVGDKSSESATSGAFVLHTDDGHRITVSPPAILASCLVPLSSKRCHWKDLDAATSERHKRIAPGPGTHIVVESAAVREGQCIVVIGRATAYEPVPGGKDVGYREAPARRVSAIKAEAIGVGPDASTAARALIGEQDASSRDERRARLDDPSGGPRSPWRWLLRAVLAAPLLALAFRALANTLPHNSGMAVKVSICFWGLGAYLIGRGRIFRDSEDYRIGSAIAPGFVTAAALVGSGLFAIAGVLASASDSTYRLAGGSQVMVGLMIGVFGLCTLDALLAHRMCRSFARLFTARRDWRVLEGTLASTFNASKISIAAPGGLRTIILKGVTRATEKVDAHVMGSGKTSMTFRYHDVSEGGPVLVAGRFDEDDRELQIRGPGSLVLFGCEPGHDPRAVMARRTRELGWLAFELSTCLVVTLLLVAIF